MFEDPNIKDQQISYQIKLQISSDWMAHKTKWSMMFAYMHKDLHFIPLYTYLTNREHMRSNNYLYAQHSEISLKIAIRTFWCRLQITNNLSFYETSRQTIISYEWHKVG